jgi:diacylglycerol kinase family enzyme
VKIPTYQCHADQQRVIVSLNPKAGARGGEPLAKELVERLEALGIESKLTSDLDEVVDLTTRWGDEGSLRAVVAGGGDGTVGLLANLLPAGAPLSILPLGTENLLSRHLGIRPCAEQAAEVISVGQGVRMDAGEADGRLFLSMLGVGLDADVVRRLDAGRSGHINHLSYARPIIESICNYQYPELRVYANGGEQPVAAKWTFVVNLPRYAGGLSLSPGANEFDGKLNVCTFRQGSLWHGLRYLTGVVLQQHQHWDDVQIEPIEVVRIESDGEVPYQLDGDVGGVLPVEARVLRERLTLLAPMSWPAQRGADLES